MAVIMRDAQHTRNLAAARHFHRCRICLSVVAADGAPWAQHAVACGACGATSWDYMGQVGASSRLVRHGIKSVCDDRCTGAKGPHCNCQCGGRNHGAGLLVVVTTTDAGAIPSVTPVGDHDRARAIAEEWRATERATLDAIEARYGATLRAKRAGQWIENFSAYLAGERYVDRLNAARRMTSQAGRLGACRAILADLVVLLT